MQEAKWKKPTEAQRKFFEKNKLILPVRALAAYNIITYIQEETGIRYLQRIGLIRSLQNLIGTTLDTGETVEYITVIPFKKRNRRNTACSGIFVGVRAKNGNSFQCSLESCWKDGNCLLPKKNASQTIDWGRYMQFRENLLLEIGRLAKKLTETDPKWGFKRWRDDIFIFWIDPRKISGKRAVSMTATDGDFQYALMKEDEAVQIGELLTRIALPNGVAIRKLPIEGVCMYKLSINPNMFQENPV